MLKYQEVKNLVDDEKNLPLLNKIAARFGISDFKGYVNRLGGFTLAEMLVVMLIGSIFLAASMPIITKRTKTLPNPAVDEIWKYTNSNKTDIYFANKVNVNAGSVEDESFEDKTNAHDSYLYIKSPGTKDNPHIGLGVTGSSDFGFLIFGAGNKLLLGSGTTAALGDNADGSVVIGHNANSYKANSVAIGTGATVNDDNKAGGSITFYVSSFNYYYSILSLHNFISDTTFSYSTCHYYSKVEGYYQDPVCSYAYGVGYSCSVGSCTYIYGKGQQCTGVYHPAYYNIHYYTCITGMSFSYSYRFHGVRAAGATDLPFSVKVRCPETIVVKSSATGYSKTIYAAPDLVGDYTAFLKVTASGYHSDWKSTYSYALYTFELAHVAITPTYSTNKYEIQFGWCHDEINSTTTPTGIKIANAKADIRNHDIAHFASTPGIAIGYGAVASSKNTIAIGYEAKANVDNLIVLGTDSSTLHVAGKTYTSDLGLKNIKGIYKRGIKELRKLKTYLFSFKSDEDNVVRAGLIAQDVQKVMPEAVSVTDKNGHLAIKSEYINFAMFNAILDLDKSLDAISKRQFVLERKISKQEIRIQKLKKTINELKKNK